MALPSTVASATYRKPHNHAASLSNGLSSSKLLSQLNMRRLTRTKSIASLKSTRSFALRRTKSFFKPLRRRRDAITPTTPHPQRICRLLLLPPELRNEIYTYALQTSTPEDRIELRTLTLPPLLRTCRKVLLEATSIFFASNYFVWTIVFTRWKEVEPITTFPVQKIAPLFPSTTKIGPILDMTLEMWMPWVFLHGVNNWCDPHRLEIAQVRKPGQGEWWIPSVENLPMHVAAMLEGWSPPGDPSFEEVLRGVVWPVWSYFKVSYAFGEEPRTIQERRWKRFRTRVLDWLDGKLIRDRMSEDSSSLSSL